MILQESPPISPESLESMPCVTGSHSESGLESPNDVILIKSESKAPGPTCHAGPELEDAHRCWPFGNGGHILEFVDELFHIAVSSESRELEAVPVTRWCLTSPIYFSESCHQGIYRERWCCWSFWFYGSYFFCFSHLVSLFPYTGPLNYSESHRCHQCSSFVGRM